MGNANNTWHSGWWEEYWTVSPNVTHRGREGVSQSVTVKGRIVDNVQSEKSSPTHIWSSQKKVAGVHFMKKSSTTLSDLKSRLAAPLLLIHSGQFCMIIVNTWTKKTFMLDCVYLIIFLLLFKYHLLMFKYNFINIIKLFIFALDKYKKKNKTDAWLWRCSLVLSREREKIWISYT